MSEDVDAPSFDLVDPGGDDARRAMDAYFAELDHRFPGGFEPGDALDDGARSLAPPTGAFYLVRLGGRTVGCGGLQRLDDSTAEVKRMWIAPEHRGRGLAGRLLAELESRARQLGHRRVVLDTNAELGEAIALYRRAGYEATEPYNHNPYAQRWFSKSL